MQQKSFKKIIATVLVSALVGLFSMLNLPSCDALKPNAWMANLSDTASVKTLSIPGTHDSGATHSIFDVSGKCQDTSIKSQLNMGVRFFDLRLQLINDEFQIVHSFVKQNLTFKSVLNDFKEFLTKNPTEFLLISIKEEESSVNSTKWFDDALYEELQPYESLCDFSATVPETVGEARGKMLFISRFNGNIGVPAYFGWQDSTTFEMGELYVQDNYCITDLEIKKQDILSALQFSKTNSSHLVLNFTSCYLDGAFPPTYAGTAGREINLWFKGVLKSTTGSTGVIVADFISADISKLIYGRNFL